ncbi:MAG: hypothetical protein K0Q48_3130 [Bacillota bacterium]|jgi:hypothetical protein|nr:hypothetical protein [Bacillota bacterium]
MMEDILKELNSKEYIHALGDAYDIRFCRTDEAPELQRFIDTHWKKGHIFARSKALLDWQHYDKENDRYNFMISKHRKSGEMHSILGFVFSSQFDPHIEETQLWPCIWKVREDVHVKGLGISLYYYLKEAIPTETISILGISDIALSIYKSWGFQTGLMDHFFILNDHISDYQMVLQESSSSSGQSTETQRSASMINKPCPLTEEVSAGWPLTDFAPASLDCDCRLEQLDEAHFRAAAAGLTLPRYKSIQYYLNRFFRHPVYQYDIYGVFSENSIQCILITRTCRSGVACCIRIVDFIGPEEGILGAYRSLKDLLYEKNAEYLDFVAAGRNESLLLNAGFQKKQGIMVLPHYFEPFLLQNVELSYAFKTVSTDSAKIFYKADADQDRPNLL